MAGDSGGSPPFGEYIVYVDESGSPAGVDPSYPVFVLAFCVVRKRDYAQALIPAMASFKFRHFGHDQVVLHEHEIRKQKGPFVFLVDAARRAAFHDGLHALVAEAPYTVIGVVIRKDLLSPDERELGTVYETAMMLGLERLVTFLSERGEDGRITHVVFEARGAKEDRELELEFRRLADERKRGGPDLEFLVVGKQTISTGLQFADLVARPIGLRVLRPEQPNRTWPVLESKLLRGPDGTIEGHGLVTWPPPPQKQEAPGRGILRSPGADQDTPVHLSSKDK